jgi:CxxC motif-containing protein (DUF1111 family)
MKVSYANLLSACSTVALMMAAVPLVGSPAQAQSTTTSTRSSSSTTTTTTTKASTAATTASPDASASVSAINPALFLSTVTGVPVDVPSNTEGAAAAGVTDPGVRGGAAGAGGIIATITAQQNTDEENFFHSARIRFQEVDSVDPTVTGITDVDAGLETPITGGGLGPSFNGNSCAQCHIFPAIGGGSPQTLNPQTTLATLDNATNTIPPFVFNGGPIREARFIFNSNGTADGGVHDLFVITGRTDATGQPNANTGTDTTCAVKQTNFPAQIADNFNPIFRIPISVFGDGLVENIGELKLEAAASAAASTASSLGVTTGDFNKSGNDGTITRFGWKAQNKSMLVFSGEAYNVEMGVTNENFQNERVEQFQSGGNNDSATAITDCLFNATPEDATNFENNFNTNSTGSDFSSDITNFAGFMRFLNPPTPAAATAATNAGLAAFENIGCGVCHTQTFTTDASAFLNNATVTFSPFSDFAIHNMGTVLADFVTQGNADGFHFRSAPLFGVGQRAFFLSDGRTTNLVIAIEDHASLGSEANEVIANFNALAAASQQNIISFLRSL